MELHIVNGPPSIWVNSIAGVAYVRCTVLMCPNKDETPDHCCDPALSVLVMFGVLKHLSRTISLAVYCLSTVVTVYCLLLFVSFFVLFFFSFWLIRSACRTYGVGSIHRMQSLSVTRFSMILHFSLRFSTSTQLRNVWLSKLSIQNHAALSSQIL